MTVDILDGQTTSVVDPMMDVNIAAGVTSTITSGDNILFNDQVSDGSTVTNSGTLINTDADDEDVVVFIDNSEDDISVVNTATGVLQGVNGVIFAEGDGTTITNAGLIEGTGNATEGVVYFDRDTDSLAQTIINSGTITGVGGPTIGFDSLLGNDGSSGTLFDETGTSLFVLDNSGVISNTDTVDAINDSDSDAINFNGDPGNTGGVSRGSIDISAAGVVQVNSQIELDITNSGTISAARDNSSNAAIRSEDDAVLSGTITNTATGTITAAQNAIRIDAAHAEHSVVINNSGLINGDANNGILLTGDGVTVNNLAGGTISGDDFAIEVNGAGTVEVRTFDEATGVTADLDTTVLGVNNVFTNAGTLSGGDGSFDARNAGEAITFTQLGGGTLDGDFRGTTGFDDSLIVSTGAFILTDDVLDTVDVTVDATGNLTLDGTGARTIDGDLASNGVLTLDLADTHILNGDLSLAGVSTLVLTDASGLAAGAADGDIFTLIDVAGIGATSATVDASALMGAAGATFAASIVGSDLVITTTVLAEEGEDIGGTSGPDTLNGSDGDDFINGRNADDTLNGGLGDDILRGGNGADALNGDDGSDTASYIGSSIGVTVNLATGEASGGHAEGDTLTSVENLFGSSGADTLTGNDEINILTGANGDDILIAGGGASNELFGQNGNDMLFSGEGADFLNGGTGNDTTDYSLSTAAVTVQLNNGGTIDGGYATGDTVWTENIQGSAFADDINGNALANELNGGLGDDVFNASSGDDVINGEAGDDFILGSRGADTIDGGSNGAAGDTASYSNSDGQVVVDLAAGTATGSGHGSGDTLTNIENIFGSLFNDDISGDDNDNVLEGFNGDDSLSGLGGDDTLLGGGGFDFLNGGTGNDILTGNGGDDQFLFDTTDFGQDIITDFTNNRDLIDFSGSGISFEDLLIDNSSGSTVITYDDGTGNNTITLDGITSLINEADFIFDVGV